MRSFFLFFFVADCSRWAVQRPLLKKQARGPGGRKNNPEAQQKGGEGHPPPSREAAKSSRQAKPESKEGTGQARTKEGEAPAREKGGALQRQRSLLPTCSSRGGLLTQLRSTAGTTRAPISVATNTMRSSGGRAKSNNPQKELRSG